MITPAKPTILIVDTETTGLDPAQDELLQVDILSGAGEVLYNRYLKPKRTRSWTEAESINHITPAMIANAPTIDEERDTIEKILATADIIIGYNISFDVSFLQAVEIRVPEWTGSPPPCTYEDVMSQFAPIFGLWSEYHHAYRWQSLGVAAHWYSYTWPDGEAHDAITDCRATLYIWNAMNRNGDWERANDLIRKSNYPQKREVTLPCKSQS